MISVHRRLLIGLIALVLAVDGVAGWLGYQQALISAGTLLDYQLRQMALSLRDQGAALPGVRIPIDDPGFDFVIQIWDRNGAPIYATPNEITRTASLGYTDLTIERERWRAYGLQTSQRVILVAQPSGVRARLAGNVALRTLAPLLILTPLLAFAIWWMVIRALAPIRRVVGEVQRRDIDSLEPLPVSGLPSELEPLIAELNRLLERLGSAFRVQRDFISDAAHELRSPLTALRVQLQLLARAVDPTARDDALARMIDAMDRAGSLVQQLLTLARNEPGASTAPLAPLALAAVVREGVMECAAFAVEKDIDLSLDASDPEPGSIPMTGDADSLRILVRNLVDNAVRYTPRGGRVGVSTGQDGAAARIEIEDSGPGVDPSAHRQLFERFHRGTGAGGTPGTGLGLAIVKAIVERHGGSIVLSRSTAGGLRVRVTLPRAPARTT